MNLHELDVYFRGGRDYIQGSLILSRTFDHLLSRDILSAGRNPVLTSAKFTSISHTGIAYSETKEKHAIGSISFKDDDNSVTVYIYKTENMPVRIDEKPSLVAGSNFTARLEGKVQFTSAANFDQIIDAVVQCTKLAHSKMEDGLYDIWFTGIAKTQFPLLPNFGDAKEIDGVLEQEPLLMREHDGFFQTLCKVSLLLGDNDPFNFNISYAYKKKRPV